MWNLKSGVSRRSSSRMSSQISSGGAGTGGPDPLEGLGRIASRGRDEREIEAPPPSAKASVHRPQSLRAGRPEAASQNARKAWLPSAGGCRQELHRRTRVDLVPWLATHEAHLPAQEAQARTDPRLSCAHEDPRR